MTVLPFSGGPPNGGVNFENFVDSITDHDRFEAVRERLKGSGAKPAIMDRAYTKVLFGALREEPKANKKLGFMYPQVIKSKASKEIIVVTSPEFPRTLAKLAGIPDVQAVELAANDALSYGLIVAGMRDIKRKSLRGSATVGMDFDLWPDDYHQGLLSVPYRAASHVALSAGGHDTKGLDLAPAGHQLPPHLAALQNPADRGLANTVISTYLG